MTVIATLVNGLPSVMGDSCIADEASEPEYIGQIVYSNDGHLEVFDFETQETTMYTVDRVMAYPEWNPRQDDTIAYGLWNLYLLNIETYDVTQLVRGGGSPSWSPTGNALVYHYNRNPRGLYIVDLDDLQIRHLPVQDERSDVYPAFPEWSPDGRTIAFINDDGHGNYNIFTIDAECQEDKLEKCTPRQLTDSEGSNVSPGWSPDGSRIAFSSNRNGEWAVYTMNSDGADVRQLTSNPEGDHGPTYSPDGDYIAFERDSRVPGPLGSNIYLMRVDGTEVQCVTSQGGVEPDWNPNRIATVAEND
jgi:Tol biopolymer transport system component